MPKTVMALVPHPDDAEYHAGGLLSNFAAEGARIVIVIATDGRCGSFDMESDELAQVRSQEAGRAAEVLGAEAPIMLGYRDFEADRIPVGELREKFMRLIRQYRPDVTISEDPEGAMETHPDHRAVARAAYEAILYAQFPLIESGQLREGLQPHMVTEKYYWAEQHVDANRVVDISESMDRKMAALAEHASQVKFLVEGIFRQAAMAGLDIQGALGISASDPLAALTWAMHEQAARSGAQAGYRFAEAYRYERYHPFVEEFLTRGGE
jgi:LmbE family N-acetylglucosaminyl deacetylase